MVIGRATRSFANDSYDSFANPQRSKVTWQRE
jgi:hypothetical protein